MSQTVRAAAEPKVATATHPPPQPPAAQPEEPPRLGLLRLCALALGVGIVDGLRRGGVPRPDRAGPQRAVPRPLRPRLRRQPVHAAAALGRLRHPGAGDRRRSASPGWSPRFAPEAKGHGVPEVMDAIYYQRGVIRPVVAVVKSLASALSIGSGAAVGREGPIIQIGSALGSTLGQIDTNAGGRSASRWSPPAPAPASPPPSTRRSAACCSRPS